jgi:hypothetical protein
MGKRKPILAQHFKDWKKSESYLEVQPVPRSKQIALQL